MRIVARLGRNVQLCVASLHVCLQTAGICTPHQRAMRRPISVAFLDQSVHKASRHSTSGAHLPKHGASAPAHRQATRRTPMTHQAPPTLPKTTVSSSSRARRRRATSASRSRRSAAGPTPATSAATGRPAASGASRATSSTTSSPRCTRDELPTPARASPRSAALRPARCEVAWQSLSSPGGRTSRAACDRTRSPAAARSSRRRRRSARRSSRPAGSRPPGARRRRRRAARASGCGSSAGRRGATTSVRAVSEWGAMNDTTKPSTPHAITGPPLARL